MNLQARGVEAYVIGLLTDYVTDSTVAVELPDRPQPASKGSWRPGLVAITVVALGVRLLAIFTHQPRLRYGDSLYYYSQGLAIANGHWFINALVYDRTGNSVPSALHPPVFTLFVAAVAKFGVTSVRGEEIATGVLGTGTVVLVAYAGRRLAGARAGLIAGAVAAVYPILWSTDRLLLSEAMAAFLAAAIVLAATAYTDCPTNALALTVGALVALLALTRAEGILLVALLALPLFLRARAARSTVRWRHGLFALGAFALLVAPWVGFNMARFKEPTFISTNDGGVLADSYCDRTFNGSEVGWWDVRCLPFAPPGDESQQDQAMRDRAFRFMRRHEAAVARVVGFRLVRMVDLYKPWTTASQEGYEDRGVPAARATVIGWFVIVPFGIAGLFVLAARRRPILPILALLGASLVTAAVFYGSPRFRMVGEVGLLIAAGAGLDATWSWLRRATGPAPPPA